MTQWDKLKNIELKELIDWFDENFESDENPWDKWFNDNYCMTCPSVEHEFSYCELCDECRYFTEYGRPLDNKDIIELWLRSEDVK